MNNSAVEVAGTRKTSVKPTDSHVLLRRNILLNSGKILPNAAGFRPHVNTRASLRMSTDDMDTARVGLLNHSQNSEIATSNARR